MDLVNIKKDKKFLELLAFKSNMSIDKLSESLEDEYVQIFDNAEKAYRYYYLYEGEEVGKFASEYILDKYIVNRLQEEKCDSIIELLCIDASIIILNYEGTKLYVRV